MICRLCGSAELESVVDLGATPPCERFLAVDQLDEPEPTYPLHLRVCRGCWLAQIPPSITPEDTFTEYAYFSSYSTSWVEHARRFVEHAISRTRPEFVVEVASNDGYLLQHVVERGIRCLGVEPSVNVGAAAREKGVPTLTAFLNKETGARVRSEHGPADLVVANNVYAHIPDIHGFTAGLRELVADDGWVSIEVQHLLSLVRENQYDTIYHEHFQYYTVASAQRALASGGLSVVDVELLDTHGGSIRLWARPVETGAAPGPRVADVLALEKAAGLHELSGYAGFAQRVAGVRRDLLGFLIGAAERGELVVGYGAPGKGNTLLNHCGIRTDLLAYTVASAQRALAEGGLHLVDVELLPTHGGSIRLWARPVEAETSPAVHRVLAEERKAGLLDMSGYHGFARRVADVRQNLLRFLLGAAATGKRVAGYGAPGKGNTLLNHCGIRPDILPYTVDRNPYKHGKFTPGTRIPVHPPERIAEDKPDYVLVLPWNLRTELTEQLSYVGEWGGRLVFPIPALEEVQP